MSVPTLVKTWQFDINNTATGTDGAAMRRAMLFGIKSAFVDGATFTTPWVVDYSCDSATAGTPGDGVDRWAADTDLVWGVGLTSARSWLVLRLTDYFSAGRHLYLLLDLCQGSTGYSHGAIGVYLSREGFTGGAPTARPTATDENEVLPSNGTNTTGNWQGYDVSTETSKRWHVAASSDGKHWRVFTCSSGYVQACWLIGDLVDPPVGWSEPYFAMIHGEDSNSSDAPTFDEITNRSDPIVRCHATTPGTFRGTLVSPATHAGSTSPLVSQACPPNFFDSSRPLLSTGLYVHTDQSAPGYHGPIADLWLGLVSDPTGDTAPAAQPSFAKFGILVTPWDGASIPAVS